MRTTLALDDDIYEVAVTRARSLRLSLGKVVSNMARVSLGAVRMEEDDRGFPVLQAPAGSSPITTERVRQLMEEMDNDEAAGTSGH